MYCANCGSEVQSSDAFCPRCGERVAGAGAASPASPGPVAVAASPAVAAPLADLRFETAEERTAYEKWKQEGMFEKRTADILGFIGIFIFGWLLWYAYSRAGRSAWHIFIPIFFFYMLARIEAVFIVVGLGIYIWAWINVRNVLGRYESLYAQESGQR